MIVFQEFAKFVFMELFIKFINVAKDQSKIKIILFASGGKKGGGSGFYNLVKFLRYFNLPIEILAVVSNHKNGGVYEKAQELGIPFEYMRENTAENYKKIIKKYNPDVVSLSGWIKLVKGITNIPVINIHPGPLPDFGGQGMYGINVHKAVYNAFKDGSITHTAVTMHFVNENYDEGPTIFSIKVPIYEDDTPETIAKRVNQMEHIVQPIISILVALEEITLDLETNKVLFSDVADETICAMKKELPNHDLFAA